MNKQDKEQQAEAEMRQVASRWDTMLRLDRTLELNGQQVAVEVTVRIQPDVETDPGAGAWDSENERENYLQRFSEAGDLMNVVVEVTARAVGQEAKCTRSGCHVRARVMQREVEEVVKDEAMIELALDGLAKQIVDTANLLKPFVRAA